MGHQLKTHASQKKKKKCVVIVENTRNRQAEGACMQLSVECFVISLFKWQLQYYFTFAAQLSSNTQRKLRQIIKI